MPHNDYAEHLLAARPERKAKMNSSARPSIPRHLGTLIALLSILALAESAGAAQITASVDPEAGIVIDIPDITPFQVDEYLWNGRSLSEELSQWLAEGTASIEEGHGQFRLTLSPEVEGGIQRFSQGVFSVVLDSGTRISTPIALDVMPWHLKHKGFKVVGCGGYSSLNNPYPCCDNNSNGSTSDSNDGNCTWWAWKMVKDTWGHSLPPWSNAKTWDDNDKKPINKTSGYVILPVPTVRSLGVANSLGTVGHVAWVTSIGSGTVTVREMNCSSPAILPNVRNASYTSSTFQSYITGMQLYDFWIKANSITASANAGFSNPNFDAQFKIRNVTTGERYSFRRLALAVHDNSGRFLSDFFRGPGNATSASYTVAELSSVATDGLDGAESVAVPKSYAYFTQPGTYRIVAKIQLMDNTWVDVGYYTLTVL